MKLSRYNVIRHFGDTTIFFNSKTCALAKLDENGLRIIEDIKNGCYSEACYDQEIVTAMKRVGCIIKDDVNEVDQIKYMNGVTKFNSAVLGLTIAPTMDCNYRCVYCFEEHSKSRMLFDVQDAIVKYVEDNIKNLKTLVVTWFGGEPMLEKETVYALSKKFICLCDRYDVEYGATLVTNGSLITFDDVEQIKYSKISNVQITVDGPKAIHDKRRIDISGKSSFDKIIENINLLLNGGIDVRVRVNIDKGNYEKVDELLLELKTRICEYERVVVSFGHVQPYTDECKCIKNTCISSVDYAARSLELYSKAVSYGFKRNRMSFYPHVRMTHCGASMKNSVLIDPDGDMYKCSSHIGDKEFSYGNIVNGYDLGSFKYLDWILWDPFKYEKCRKCVLLPLCMGGCQALAKNSSLKGKAPNPKCETVKYNLDSILLYYYQTLKK